MDPTSASPDTQRGLALSRRLFEDWGLPLLQSEFSGLVGRVAAVATSGSQAIGADDEISRDHAWGPRFDWVLTEADFVRDGARLTAVVRDHLPAEFLPVERRVVWEQRTTAVDVLSVGQYLQRAIGRDRYPRSAANWLALERNESALYWLRHTPVFYDPLGQFTHRKNEFAHYPPDMALKRTCDEIWAVWHYGEYNFLSRMLQRRDVVAIAACLGSFLTAVMRLCFLLNDDYCPYWKWLHHEFRRLPEAEELDPLLARLAEEHNLDVRGELVRETCRVVRRRLVRANLLDDQARPDLSDWVLNLRQRINDPQLR